MKISENFNWSKYEKIITYDYHHVPALRNFAHINYLKTFSTRLQHVHEHILEFFYVANGVHKTRIEENGKYIDYSITGGQLMIIYPGELHNTIDDIQSPCDYYYFQVDTSDPDNMLNLNKEYSNLLCSSLISLSSHTYNAGKTGLRQISAAFNFFSDFSRLSIAIGVQYLTSFLFTLPLLPVLDACNEQIPADPSIQTAIHYIKVNIDTSISLEDLAAVSGYSISHFKVKFKSCIGISPAEYIASQKIEVAKIRLEKSSENITSIATSLGFSTSNYFCNVFKKYTGLTPSDYRKQHKTP